MPSSKEDRARYQRDYIRRRKLRDPSWTDYDPAYDRNYHLVKKYGITSEQFNEMYDRQGGVCKICHTKDAIVVDHSHDTGDVRGLLCRTCNTGIGHLNDDPKLVIAAALYLLTFA